MTSACDPWSTVIGVSLTQETDWQRCPPPSATDVVLTSHTELPLTPPLSVLSILQRHVKAGWMMSCLQELLHQQTQTVRVLLTYTPPAHMHRLQVQLHVPLFHTSMTRVLPFPGFSAFVDLLVTLGPNNLMRNYVVPNDAINSAPLDAAHANLPPATKWKLPLLPHQCESLLWMQCLEAVLLPQQTPLVTYPLFYPLAASDYMLNFFTKQIVHRAHVEALPHSSVTVPFFGGILADGTGTGKTAVALALVASAPRAPSNPQLLLHQHSQHHSPYMLSQALTAVTMHVPTTASLIIVPFNLAKQWQSEVAKFVNTDPSRDGMRVISIFCKRDYENVSVLDVIQADLVLTSIKFLNGPLYGRRMRQGDPDTVSRHYSALHAAGKLDNTHSVVFHALMWKRIIFDEQHELVLTRTLLSLLGQLKAEVYWGLSATPRLDKHNFVFHLQPDAQVAFNMFHTSLIHQAVRRTVRGQGMSSVQVHQCLVPINDQERGLLEANRHRGLEALVQLATCFNVLALFGAAGDEESQLVVMTFAQLAQVMLTKLARECQDAQRERSAAQASVETLHSHLGQLGADVDTVSDSRLVRSLQRQLVAGQAKLVKAQEVVQCVDTQRSFFQSQLLSTPQQQPCPICFEDGVSVVTPCGHWFCKQCVTQYRRTQVSTRSCPVCKRELRLSEWIEVTEEQSQAAAQAGEHHFSSKLAAIVHLLRRIRSQGERAILFIQWNALMRAVKALLLAGGVTAVAMHGNTNVMQMAVQKFRAGQADVLLLSLETSASGLNLVDANHVIFAHALVNKNPAEHTRLMQQAVGRVLRVGQDKQVHVHWFITEDTDEHRLFNTQFS